MKKLEQVRFKAGPITTRFNSAAISVSGDIGEVILREEDDPKKYLILTYPQAVSLAKAILERCQ